MATTVNAAFNKFLENSVNLDPEDTKKARTSRDWLIKQIRGFRDSDNTFPKLLPGRDIAFGSFARKTKKRPLDDIDIMICLHAQGSIWNEYEQPHQIYVSSTAGSDLMNLCFDGTYLLNSTKVINRFVSALSAVPQYEKAEMNKRQEAATLNLSSYDWVFDIVPCFITNENMLGITYYMIPDGSGTWKLTDPRIDQDRVQRINQEHSGRVLNVIRILKYWNQRPTMPSMPSYLIENMILDYYEGTPSTLSSSFIDLEIPRVLRYVRDHIHQTVNDPKGIQGNINTLGFEERQKIYARAILDLNRALEARMLESDQDLSGSIDKWREVFGAEFPIYG